MCGKSQITCSNKSSFSTNYIYNCFLKKIWGQLSSVVYFVTEIYSLKLGNFMTWCFYLKTQYSEGSISIFLVDKRVLGKVKK